MTQKYYPLGDTCPQNEKVNIKPWYRQLISKNFRLDGIIFEEVLLIVKMDKLSLNICSKFHSGVQHLIMCQDFISSMLSITLDSASTTEIRENNYIINFIIFYFLSRPTEWWGDQAIPFLEIDNHLDLGFLFFTDVFI